MLLFRVPTPTLTPRPRSRGRPQCAARSATITGLKSRYSAIGDFQEAVK
jgi:hypothetical protein